MAAFTDLHMQNVRCFRSEQSVPIRPITLLVGENSTGKTTFLGCYQVLRKLMEGYPIGPSSHNVFKDTALSTGAFREIVSSKSKSDQFKLGATLRLNELGWACDIRYSFAESKVGPTIAEVSYDFGKDQQLTLQFDPQDTLMPNIAGPGFVIEAEKSSAIGLHNLSMQHVAYYLEHISMLANKTVAPRYKENCRKLGDFLERNFVHNKVHIDPLLGYTSSELELYEASDVVVAVPPVRSRPRRTYDNFDDDATHMAEQLQRLLSAKSRKAGNGASKILSFGKDSKMFSDIKVKQLGTEVSNPFEVQVNARGSLANILHVGYGVSQVMPILAEVASATARTIFLLQEPEVHLHPRSQAALASYFIEATKEGHSFIIETHGNYIVDRCRIDARKGKLDPNLISLLFFAPAGSNVEIQRIKIDVHGNLLNPSVKYGDFFLDEGMELLGFEST